MWKLSLYFSTLLICSTVFAENWIDISPPNQNGVNFIDVDSITILQNPNRIVYKYKNVSNTENVAQVVILCDSAQWYFDFVSIYRKDGNIVGIYNKDSELESVVKGNLAYWTYENYCFKKD